MNFDISFQDMLSFQDDSQSGAKTCILNLEAFTLFYSQNKGNEQKMQKLLDDIFLIN